MNLKDKCVWITGASSGIGEALLYECLEREATVIASSDDTEKLNSIKETCINGSDRLIIKPFDLSDTDQIEQLVESVISETKGIDYLINMGGISQRSIITETPLWIDRKIMEINYFGTIALSKAVLTHMISRRKGHIIVTSSISGRFGFPLRSAYSASKQALHGFIETLHLENKKHNIRGSVVIPGRVKTNISVNALGSDGKPQNKMDPGQANAMSAHSAAVKILKGIARNRREILVGRKEMLMLHIRRYAPWLFFRIASRIEAR